MNTAKGVIKLENHHSFIEKVISILKKEDSNFKVLPLIPENLIPEKIDYLYEATCTAIISLEKGKAPKLIKNNFVNRMLSFFNSWLVVEHYKPIHVDKVYVQADDESYVELFRYFFEYPDRTFPQLAQVIFCSSEIYDSLIEELFELRIYPEKPKRLTPGFDYQRPC